ncbi:MAG: DUF4388 domain-containing protein [Myxococcota bacterium]
MALKGTLKDFGIADIFQLIGQQQKTGLLHLKSKDQEVHIGFKNGDIVKAENTTRRKKDLIGNMLVRAQIISEQQLEHALQSQKRTLQRLGDVLVATQALTPARFKQMVHLQMTETLYKLFSWKSGSYEFEQTEDVDYDSSAVTPLRAESVLMEGFRMVDEWPVIRKRITSYQMTFARAKELPPQTKRDTDDDELDAAFGEVKKEVNDGEFKSIGESERRVYALTVPGRDVRTIIDQSCLGEFETCKALCNLVNLEFLRAVPAKGRGETIAVDTTVLERVARAVGVVMVTVLVLAGLAFLVSRLNLDSLRLSGQPASSYSDPAAQRLVSRHQLARLEAALDVYRLEKGELPEKLEALVEAGLLGPKDLRHPWRDGYYYRRTQSGFVLLPPLR